MSSIAPPCHTRGSRTTDDWITPRFLLDALGSFDLDPCACIPQPWPCADRQYTVNDNGLLQPWRSGEFVFCNPPYGKQTAAWLNRMAQHNDGIALVFARTETRMFFEFVWPYAKAVLFIKGRLTFCYPDGEGSKAGHNSGGPSCLIAYGDRAAKRLEANRKLGALVRVV